MIKFCRAIDNKNKLEVMDNRPFVIEINIGVRGVIVSFFDIFGEIRKGKTLWYEDMMSLKEEWEFIDNIDYPHFGFNVINYY